MKELREGARKLGIELSGEMLEKFEGYYGELIEWNRKINLTRITDYEEVQIKHFLDSLTIATVPGILKSGTRVIDVGSGAGLPGLPLKIYKKDIRLTLLEATGKKAQFLGQLVEKLGLEGVEVMTGRAEDTAHRTEYRERYDLAVARGVAPMAALAELTLPFCKAGGSFIALKKGDIEEEMRQAERAIETMGGELREMRNVANDVFGDDRRLVIIDKVKATPEKYPRRAGVPAKRPITQGN